MQGSQTEKLVSAWAGATGECIEGGRGEGDSRAASVMCAGLTLG